MATSGKTAPEIVMDAGPPLSRDPFSSAMRVFTVKGLANGSGLP